MSDNALMSGSATTIFYDADCGFCRRTLRVVLRLDHLNGHMLVARAIQDPRAADALAELSPTEQLESWHLGLADGTVVSGGAAIPALLRVWGWPEWIPTVFEQYPNATDASYRWVARHRAQLGRLTKWMPDLPQKHAESVSERENPPR